MTINKISGEKINIADMKNSSGSTISQTIKEDKNFSWIDFLKYSAIILITIVMLIILFMYSTGKLSNEQISQFLKFIP